MGTPAAATYNRHVNVLSHNPAGSSLRVSYISMLCATGPAGLTLRGCCVLIFHVLDRLSRMCVERYARWMACPARQTETRLRAARASTDRVRDACRPSCACVRPRDLSMLGCRSAARSVLDAIQNLDSYRWQVAGARVCG